MRSKRRRWLRRLSDAGDMGIGTLILFIAMVLVAAVAAAVLISTAGNLQQQGQETGTQATRDVAGGLEINSVQGDRHTDGNNSGINQPTIQLLELRVSLTSGSPAIDFEELVIMISDGNATMDLIFNDTGTSGFDCNARYYVATAIRDSDASWDDHVITRGDIVRIMICTDNATNLDLTTNVDVWLEIIPEAGNPTYEVFTTPNTYSTRYIELA